MKAVTVKSTRIELLTVKLKRHVVPSVYWSRARVPLEGVLVMVVLKVADSVHVSLLDEEA